MNILFLTRLFYPHIGGVEKHVEEISKRLIKRSYKVTIVTELLSGSKHEEKKDGIEIIRFNYPKISIACFSLSLKIKFLGLIWIWIWVLRNFQLIKRVDIVHIHDVFIWYLPFRFLFPNKPVYVTFHGWEGKYPIPWKNKFLRKIAEKLTWGNICVGDFLSKWYGTKPNFVTYGGINKNQMLKVKNQNYLPENATHYALQAGNAKFKILFIGRLSQDTGLPIYLKTLKLLKQDKTKMDFLGDGELADKATEYGTVHGFVEDILPYLVETRFVFTSGYLSILEAMTVKRLVFAVYDNPVKRDYLKMSPFAKWIVAEKSPKILAEKILYYLNHPGKVKQLTGEAYAWVQRQTWENVEEKYLTLWRL